MQDTLVKKINILVITKSPWKETNPIGNTFSNFFGSWQEAEFYNLYLRDELPDNDICSRYYCVSEKQILKNFFSPDRVGISFSKESIHLMNKEQEYLSTVRREKKLLDFFRSDNKNIFHILRESVWATGIWKNRKLDNFLKEKHIDFVFVVSTGLKYVQDVADYCVKATNAKLILFFSDDTYCHKTKKPVEYFYQSFIQNQIIASVRKAAKIYGASQKLCDEYSQYFGKKIEPLYKGCFFDNTSPKTSTSSPVKLIYAGNLFYGRWKILEKLAEEIERINSESIKMTLEIYTTSTITAELTRALNRKSSSKILKALPYEKIKEVFASADIVLHVESFELKEIKTTRLSFSTKIIDCMQSGRCLMAIGPENVASIEYLKKTDGAVVICNSSEIGRTLNDLITNPEQIIEKSMELRRYALINHNIESVRKKLHLDFEQMI